MKYLGKGIVIFAFLYMILITVLFTDEIRNRVGTLLSTLFIA